MKRTSSSIFSNISGVFAIVLMGFPVYWMVTTSFKPKGDILSTNPSVIPHSFSLSNYVEAVTKEGFTRALLNSVIVVFFTVIISLFVALYCIDCSCPHEIQG